QLLFYPIRIRVSDCTEWQWGIEGELSRVRLRTRRPAAFKLRAPGGADVDSRRESSDFTSRLETHQASDFLVFRALRRGVSAVSRGRPIVCSLSNSVTGVITSMRY